MRWRYEGLEREDFSSGDDALSMFTQEEQEVEKGNLA